MQADIFYTTTKEQAIQISLLSKNEAKKIKLDEFTRNTWQAAQFQGNCGELSFTFDKSGAINKVFLGTGDDNKYDYLAQAAINLPEGVYFLDSYLPEHILLSWSLAQYKFTKYKNSHAKPRVLFIKDKKNIVNKAQAVFLTRDLINTPTNDLGPEQLASELKKLAKESSAKFTEWVGAELIKNNFPAIYTVGQASSSKPRLLSLVWGDNNHPKVTLVGKGVCFDSGGLDIKTSSGMRIMKKDMGGAAHVIGLAKLIISMQLPIRLHVLIPAVENSISGSAYRPGDVITMRNGMTVEVDNTDAEGRLVLADAISYACEEQPDLIIDFATLTGAARIAVGTDIAAMFCNNDAIANSILASSTKTQDPIWRMPLFSAYNSLIDSSIADMSNSGQLAYGGAITAALFLQKYVLNNIPWVHFDIMAWNLSNNPGKPQGGEAMAIMAVINYLSEKYT